MAALSLSTTALRTRSPIVVRNEPLALTIVAIGCVEAQILSAHRYGLIQRPPTVVHPIENRKTCQQLHHALHGEPFVAVNARAFGALYRADAHPAIEATRQPEKLLLQRIAPRQRRKRRSEKYEVTKKPTPRPFPGTRRRCELYETQCRLDLVKESPVA